MSRAGVGGERKAVAEERGKWPMAVESVGRKGVAAEDPTLKGEAHEEPKARRDNDWRDHRYCRDHPDHRLELLDRASRHADRAYRLRRFREGQVVLTVLGIQGLGNETNVTPDASTNSRLTRVVEPNALPQNVRE